MDDFYPSLNGVIVVMDNYARVLSDRCEFVFVVPTLGQKNDDNFLYKVIRVTSIYMKRFGYAWTLPRIAFKAKKTLRNEHFDIIHIHSPFVMGSFALKEAKKRKIPVVSTIHTQFNYDFDRMLSFNFSKNILKHHVKKIYNKSNECYTVNPAIKKVHQDLGVKTSISIIPNATEMLTSSTVEDDKNYINEKYGLKSNQNILLFVGRINVVKNVLFILDCLKRLVDNNINFKMLFVGPFEDEDLFYKKVKSLNLESNIIICGKIIDREILKKIYVRADLFLFPSFYDTSSLVQVEAASQYTPTVFVKDSATSSGVVNDDNGFVAPYNVECYSDKIIEVLNNKDLLDKVSKNCHKTLYVTWDKVCDNVYDKYVSIINKSH